MFYKATDGRGRWYGSLDGEMWVRFNHEPTPDGECHVKAVLSVLSNPDTIFFKQKQQHFQTRDALQRQGFTFSGVEAMLDRSATSRS